ncbi:MAG: hypothetical protein ACKVP0_19950 [Pirellulaceae bacterium]
MFPAVAPELLPLLLPPLELLLPELKSELLLPPLLPELKSELLLPPEEPPPEFPLLVEP